MVGLLRWLARWPLGWLHHWGGAAGWIAYAFSPTYRRRFIENATQAGLDRAAMRVVLADALVRL